MKVQILPTLFKFHEVLMYNLPIPIRELADYVPEIERAYEYAKHHGVDFGEWLSDNTEWCESIVTSWWGKLPPQEQLDLVLIYRSELFNKKDRVSEEINHLNSWLKQKPNYGNGRMKIFYSSMDVPNVEVNFWKLENGLGYKLVISFQKEPKYGARVVLGGYGAGVVNFTVYYGSGDADYGEFSIHHADLDFATGNIPLISAGEDGYTVIWLPREFQRVDSKTFIIIT